jgi:hypothetical protein
MGSSLPAVVCLGLHKVNLPDQNNGRKLLPIRRQPMARATWPVLDVIARNAKRIRAQGRDAIRGSYSNPSRRHNSRSQDSVPEGSVFACRVPSSAGMLRIHEGSECRHCTQYGKYSSESRANEKMNG